jgi:hypothetical protein
MSGQERWVRKIARDEAMRLAASVTGDIKRMRDIVIAAGSWRAARASGDARRIEHADAALVAAVDAFSGPRVVA